MSSSFVHDSSNVVTVFLDMMLHVLFCGYNIVYKKVISKDWICVLGLCEITDVEMTLDILKLLKNAQNVLQYLLEEVYYVA